MISTNRIGFALPLLLGFAMALIGCSSSDNNGGAGGSGGAAGDGGAGGGESMALRILVTNDDGIESGGIDALVEGLRTNPENEIIVSAPAENQTSQGDMMTPTPPPLQAMETTTASGYPAYAVDGFPADAVIYALENLYTDELPHVVLSGINDTQNVGDIDVGVPIRLQVDISGTIGAAKTAACLGIPALASSQGDGEVIDFPSGVVEVLEWLEENRAALLAGEVSVDTITNLNIPSCQSGEIRGQLDVPLATENPNAWDLVNGEQDCESTVMDPPNDIEGFFNGYVTFSDVPRNKTGTCDALE
jgi:5'-nucleotidase